MKQLIIARTGYILISVVFYISGLLCIILPDIEVRWAALAGGLVLILYGAIKIIGYFSEDLYCLAFQYDFACGLFLTVLGVILLAVSRRFTGHLLSGLGILVFLDSVLSVQTALEARRFGLNAWTAILAASLLSGTVGIVLTLMPTQTIGGMALLAEGFMRQFIVQYTVPPSSSRTDRE